MIRTEVILLVCVVGLFNWGFRAVPTQIKFAGLKPNGIAQRFFAAIGSAAIASLFAVAVLPILDFQGMDAQSRAQFAPALTGLVVIVIVFWRTRSVAISTFLGTLFYALVFWINLR
jgi:branched-subunit amino acid transport protein AzlD